MLKYTKHQIPRGVLSDAETANEIVVIKYVSMLRATYQIRLLAFKAYDTGKKLVLTVRKDCQIHPTLRELSERLPMNIRIKRI